MAKAHMSGSERSRSLVMDAWLFDRNPNGVDTSRVAGRLAARGGWRSSAAMAILVASILARGVYAEESAVAKIAVPASPAASYFG